MEFAILGPLEVRHGGRTLDLGRPKQQALLALLLLHANEVVSVSRLAEDLWEEGPPRTVTGSLQAHVSRLRAALAVDGREESSLIRYRRPGYIVDVDEDALDALRFRSLVASGRAALAQGRPEVAAEVLAAATSLWRGHPLEELILGPLAHVDIARLEELRLSATEDLIEAELTLGRHREVLERLDRLVVEHPLRERFWAQRILAFYRCGRQAEALRAFGEVRRLLAEELGIDPGPELQRLEESVLHQQPELAWEGVPPGPRLTTAGVDEPAPPGRLPAPLTRFVGRTADRAALSALLADRRLVTLTGPGGSGKTRLAVEVAAQLRPAFAGGAWFADLSSAAEGPSVARAVAAALGVPEEPGQPLADGIERAVRARDVLLVLDNCEHVVASSSALAAELLERSPRLRVLATSREPLGVPGEACRPVPPLSLPPIAGPVDATVRSEAVQLFVDRATLVRPDFRLTPDNAPAVTSICHHLDGIPLAIELAAARLAVLSAHQIDERLADRFRLVADEGGDRPPRHRTLAATMEWSDALLSDAERLMLWRLSVFSGGFTLDAVEAVCSDEPIDAGEALYLLARLVAKSLVVANTSGREARYRLLETIRRHGADRLAASGATVPVQGRHAGFFVALAERAEPGLGGPEQRAWLERLESDHDNLRAALAWSLDEHEADLAARLAGALVLFWRVRGHVNEAREWLDAALAVSAGAPAAVRAKALWGAGFMSLMLHDHRSAVPPLERSIALYRQLGDVRGMGRCLLVLANSSRFTSGPAATLHLLVEAVSRAREADDSWCLAHALALAGSVCQEQGDLAEAETLVTEALDVARRAGDEQGIRMALWGLGQLRATQGRLREAEMALSEGLEVSQRLLERHATASLAACLADVQVARGDHGRARAVLDEALPVAREAGPMAMIEVLCSVGGLALASASPTDARAAFEEAVSTARTIGATSLRALLGLGDVAQRLGEGGKATSAVHDALALARSLDNRRGLAWGLEVLGRVARDEGRDSDAWADHQESLHLYRRCGDVLGMARSLAALGGLAAGASLVPEGATLLAAAGAVFAAAGGVPAPHERAVHEADLAAARQVLTPERLAAARTHGEALSLGAAADLAAGLRPGPVPPTTA